MATTRIWNVTNDPETDLAPQNLVVLGKLLKPGQSVEVDETYLQSSHKLKSETDAKFLAIGKQPPAYLARPRASMPKGSVRAHGEVKDVAAGADKVEEMLSVSSQPEPKPEAEPVQEEKDSSSYSKPAWKSKKGR